MEDLCSLMFELSNEDRLSILHRIKQKAMNISNLSKELSLTTQESSRHASRLSHVGLVRKDSNGLYHLTLCGDLVLKQLEGLRFTSQHREYFTSHSVVHIPQEFIYRLGDLANSTYVNDISVAFYSVEKLMKEAEEYIWAITDHYLLSQMPLYTEAFEREVKVRNIEAKDWIAPSEIKEAYRNMQPEHRRAAGQARTTGILEEGLLDQLDIFLYMSEKEVAAVCFPFSDGRFDYLGFTSTDGRAHKWCRDIFQYYWERSCSRESMADELYTWIKKRPEAVYVLENIAAGREILHGKEKVSELESVSLVKEGKLTILGDLVYAKLTDET